MSIVFGRLVATVLLVVWSSAHAQMLDLDVPSGALDEALLELAQQTDVQLILDAGEYDQHQVAGLSGSYTLQAALDQLLAGTGLQAELRGHTLTVVPQSAAIGTVRVVGSTLSQGAGGSSDILATEHLAEYAAPGARIGSSGAARLRDIPRAVSVLTHQRMTDQHVIDISDALDRMPSVSLEERSVDRTSAHSRAFPIEDIQLDGGGLLHSFDGLLNGQLSIYDRIELLRGSDGLGVGYGSPGGVLNLVRKRPLAQPQVVVQSSLGSWEFRDGMLDVSGPIFAQGRVRARAVASALDKDYFYQTSGLKHRNLYAVVEVDPTDQVLLRMGLQQEKLHATPWVEEGLPEIEGDRHVFGRAQSFTTPWQTDNRDTRTVFAAVDAWMGDWHLELNVDLLRSKLDELSASFIGYLDVETGDGMEFAYPLRETAVQHQRLLRFQLTRMLEIAGSRHSISLIADRSREHFNGANYVSAEDYVFPVNVYDFDPQAVPAPTVEQHLFNYIYAFERRNLTLALNLNPWPSLKLSTAWRWHDIATDDNRMLDYPSNSDHHDALSYVGINYTLSPQWSLYAATADVYEAMLQARTAAGRPPHPSIGRTYDFGVKFATVDDRTQASLGLYRIELNHPQQYVGSSQDDPRCCYNNSADYRVISQGVEAELIGRVGTHWSVSSSYQFNRNRFTGADVFVPGAAANEVVPKHQLKSWINWTPAVGQLELGLGLHAQSRTNRVEIFSLSPDGEFELNAKSQAGYARVDGRAFWAISPVWSLTLNIENLLGRDYYVARGFVFGPNLYGDPRRYRLTLKGHW